MEFVATKRKAACTRTWILYNLSGKSDRWIGHMNRMDKERKVYNTFYNQPQGWIRISRYQHDGSQWSETPKCRPKVKQRFRYDLKSVYEGF